jgi:hypothetical protein
VCVCNSHPYVFSSVLMLHCGSHFCAQPQGRRDIDHDDHPNSSTTAALTSPPNHTHPSAIAIPFRQPLPIVLPPTIHDNPLNSSANHQRIHERVRDGNRRSKPSTSRSEQWTPPIHQNYHRTTPTNHQSILTML